ncbi:MAG: acyl-CoA thioesterase [Thiobacillus sp.]|nr:acyl-CoA thioesterase [Thiobacillus sp.]
MQDIEENGRMLTCRVVAMPENTNAAGDIFGGWLLSQVDLAGSTLAVKVSSGRVATVAVNHFQFIKPVLVGDLVSCWAQVDHIGNTSIRIRIEVDAERMRSSHDKERVAEATFTYVALDTQGRPRAVVS